MLICSIVWWTLQYVPLVVEVCTQVVEDRGLANQGIYRVPGNSLAINNLVEELNRVSKASLITSVNETMSFAKFLIYSFIHCDLLLRNSG